MNADAVREFALSLPKATEEPHFHFASFRIGGRIFATMPPGNKLVHVFAPEEDRIAAIARDPEVYQELQWGRRTVGLRIVLDAADPALVLDLLQAAYDSRRSG